ncbi:Tat pathway signal protein [Falsiroseomonas oryzae]|uniref:Tat pathway signal protein n=1 Tax=Falsiroseomonas oryzae TaxID=2766473 RepID=UPI0022EA3743|nr:Tat pathway signal protein [Roseomonas sp. MO-31]
MRRHVIAVLALLAGMVGGILPTAAQAQNRFWLVNETGRTIMEAYVSSSRVSGWGPDILGSGVLPAGQRVWVTPNFGDCVLDVRVVFQGGGEETRMQVNACSLSTIAFRGGGAGAGATIGGGAGAAISPGRQVAGNPSFVFTNGTGATIREVYVSLSTDGNWGGDRLGANVLQPGGRLQVSLPAGNVCTVDMRVVYMDGRAAERRRIETCSINEFVWR